MGERKQRLAKRDPFTANQKIWLIDSVPTERDIIRQSLSPEVVTVGTWKQLLDEISTRLKNEEAYGTLIYTDNLEEDLRLAQKAIMLALNNPDVNSRLFIYHITPTGDTPFENAKVYPNVDAFLEDATNVHLESVALDDNLDEESRQIIRDLRMNNKKLQDRNESLKEKLNKQTEENKDALERLAGAKRQLELAQKSEEHAKQEQRKAEDKQQEIKIQLQTSTKEVDNKVKQINDLTHQKIELEAKIAGDKNFIEELTQQNNQLQLKCEDIQAELSKKREEATELAAAKSDMEMLSSLQEEVNASSDILRDERNKNAELQSKLSLKESKIKSLEDEVGALRHSGKSVSRFGMDTSVYPIIKLKYTQVIYFKIIDPLEFHRYYIKFFVEQMRQVFAEKYNFTTIMLKQNNGFDEKRWDDRIFIGDLNGIQDTNKDYYLVPGKSMNDGAFEFEQHGQKEKPTVLIVLDYIDNNKYYVETDSIMDKFVIAKNSTKARKNYQLAGKYIGYDFRSDIKAEWYYDKRFITLTSDNQTEYKTDKITPLIANSEVIAALDKPQ